MFLAYWCGNAWHISGKNWSHSPENRHLLLVDSRGGAKATPHVLQDDPASCVFLADAQPLSPSYSQHQTTSHTENLASLHLSSSNYWPEQAGQCLLESGRVRATFPAVTPSPWSAIHAGTEVLWSSALTAAISGPCSPVSCPSPAQESYCAASLACSDVQCWTWGSSISSTLPFLHLPFEEAIASWCFLVLINLLGYW